MLHARVFARRFTTVKKPAQAAKPVARTPRDYLHKFFLRVHPDLFQGENIDKDAEGRPLSIADQNQDSLAKLNSILDFANALTDSKGTSIRGAISRPPPSQLLSFYCRNTASKLSPLGRPIKLPSQFVRIESRYEGLAEINLSLPPAQVVKASCTAVDRCLAELMTKSGIEIPAEDISRWKKEHSKAAMAGRGAGPGAASSDGSQWPFNQYQKDIPKQEAQFDWKNYVRHKYAPLLLNKVHDKASRASEPRYTVFPALVRSKLISYVSDVLPWQREFAMGNLKQAIEKHFDSIRVSEWLGVRLHFGHQFGPYDEKDGSVLLPWNFTLPQLSEHMQREFPSAKSSNQSKAPKASKAAPSSSSSQKKSEADEQQSTAAHSDSEQFPGEEDLSQDWSIHEADIVSGAAFEAPPAEPASTPRSLFGAPAARTPPQPPKRSAAAQRAVKSTFDSVLGKQSRSGTAGLNEEGPAPRGGRS